MGLPAEAAASAFCAGSIMAATGFELGQSPTGRTESVDKRRESLFAETVYGRMLTCIGAQERAHEGLRILVDATGAATGHLLGLRGGALQLTDDVVDPVTCVS